ncbi:hypothetical protein [Maribacter sp. 2210JD10-5]|uniref:hypothetical protein n=1 Tax=Maribacter sp. 2210JD10-5 TaxID=3386272 RepID=UPI0039BCA87A
MSPFLFKIPKILILGFVPLLLISGGSKEHLETKVLPNSESLLTTKGALNQELMANVSFAFNVLSSIKEDFVSTLSINFVDTAEEDTEYEINLTITKNDNVEGIADGTYDVEKIEGFLNNFDNVFGVANIASLGEKPFFAKGGTIKIQSRRNNTLKGVLEITFVNEQGATFEIKGAFDTKNSISN